MKLVSHVFCWNGAIVDCSNNDTKYTNHSSNPSTGWNDAGDDHTYALRDITAGEEITENYGDYDSASVPFYAKLCKEYGVMTTDEVGQKFKSITPFISAE